MTKITYYVHTQKDKNDDYEVHKPSCFRLPKQSHRVDLGEHYSCSSALEEAERRGYKPADGCYHCNEECHNS